MAIFHLSAQVISRSSGRSSVAAAAYRHCARLTDTRTGLVHDYRRKRGGGDWFFLAPPTAPAWASSARLWQEVERVERRADAQTAREVVLALPCELKPGQRADLVTDFCAAQFVARGMCVDVSLHDAEGKNPHAHIMLTLREIGPAGFGKKVRDWNAPAALRDWRRAWSAYANRALERAGHAARIDHRTLRAQRIDRAPTVHLGRAVCARTRRGVSSDRTRVATPRHTPPPPPHPRPSLSALLAATAQRPSRRPSPARRTSAPSFEH